jgi:hypothetical protein
MQSRKKKNPQVRHTKGKRPEEQQVSNQSQSEKNQKTSPDTKEKKIIAQRKDEERSEHSHRKPKEPRTTRQQKPTGTEGGKQPQTQDTTHQKHHNQP